MLITILLIFLSIVLGSAARMSVGNGLSSRWATYPPVAAIILLAGAWPILEPIQTETILLHLWMVLVASLSLGMGYTQWENRTWMMCRYGLPSVVLLALPISLGLLGLGVPQILYVLICLGSGAFYPSRQRAFELLRLREASYQTPIGLIAVDSSRLAEACLGAAVLGGLIFL